MYIYITKITQGCDLTSEETRAELETLGTLSTMACFMYRSIACSMVVWWTRWKKHSWKDHLYQFHQFIYSLFLTDSKLSLLYTEINEFANSWGSHQWSCRELWLPVLCKHPLYQSCPLSSCDTNKTLISVLHKVILAVCVQKFPFLIKQHVFTLYILEKVYCKYLSK